MGHSENCHRWGDRYSDTNANASAGKSAIARLTEMGDEVLLRLMLSESLMLAMVKGCVELGVEEVF